jgi:Carbohydrate binding domain
VENKTAASGQEPVPDYLRNHTTVSATPAVLSAGSVPAREANGQAASEEPVQAPPASPAGTSTQQPFDVVNPLGEPTESLPVGSNPETTDAADDTDLPPHRLNWQTVSRPLLIPLAGLLVIVGIAVLAVHLHEASSRSLASEGASSQRLNLAAISKHLESASANPAGGTVTVNDSLVLQPTSQPGNPVAGQLYYNKATDQLDYYNGKAFVTTGGSIITDITNNYVTTPSLASVTNITNVTGSTGNVTATGGQSGSLTLFTGSSTLGNSVLSENGTGLSTSAASIEGTSADGLEIETAGAQGSSGALSIESGNSSTTGSGDVTIDTGSGVVNGTVVDAYTFETGTDNWQSNWNTTTLTQSSAYAEQGSYSLNFTSTNAAWNVAPLYPGSTTTPGHSYRVSAWVRGTTTGTVSLVACWPSTQCTTIAQITGATPAWTELSGIVTAPTGTSAMWVNVNGETATGDVVYVDNAIITDLDGFTGTTVNVGTTNALEVNVGNGNQVGATNVTGGAAGINIRTTTGAVNISSGSLTLGAGGGGTGGGVIVKPEADSTTAFQVENAAGNNALLDVDTTDNEISFGTGAGSSIGNTSIGYYTAGDTGAAVGVINGQKITTTAGGTVTSMSAYFVNTPAPNNLYQYAIYADDGTGAAPGAYIASSAVGTETTAFGNDWYTLPISATLAPNTTYWLVYWTNSSRAGFSPIANSPDANALDVASNAIAWQGGSESDNGFPATFPALAGSAQDVSSLYASYASSGPALTVNRYGTLTQQGAALFQDPTDSTQAFQIENSQAVPLFTADTADSLVTINGGLVVDGHIITEGSTPGIAADAAESSCGSDGTPSVTVTGDDTAGTITVVTGSGGTCTAGDLATIAFSSAYGAAPDVTLTPESATSGALIPYVDGSSLSAGSFAVGASNTPAPSTTYSWNYLVVQ